LAPVLGRVRRAFHPQSSTKESAMPLQHDTMIEPPVEGLLDRAGSKFRLVTLGSRRARQINSYFGQLGDGLGANIPPQVTSVSRKPLTIAFEEIAADKIVAGAKVEPVEDAEEVAESDGDDAS
jgi:DNA-directed RNA polymerase subunit omega